MKEKIHENCDFTIEEIDKFLHARSIPYAVTLEQVLEYWERKNWCTKNGEKVKSLYVAVNVPNAYVIQKKRRGDAVNFDNVVQKRNECNTWVNKKSPYNDQLADPRWKAFREFIFVVRGSKCESCGKPRKLNIHHREYINNRYAWEYLPNDVMVLCNECHRCIHEMEKKKQK